MKTKLLKIYRRDPERFKQIRDIAKHSDIDRSHLVGLLRGPSNYSIRGGSFILGGAVAGSLLCHYTFALLRYVSGNEVLDEETRGYFTGAITIAGSQLGAQILNWIDESNYSKLVREAQKNGYSSRLSPEEAGRLFSKFK